MYVYHNIKIYVINDNDLITKNKIIDFVIRKIMRSFLEKKDKMRYNNA